jgi:hypothetical protein
MPGVNRSMGKVARENAVYLPSTTGLRRLVAERSWPGLPISPGRAFGALTEEFPSTSSFLCWLREMSGLVDRATHELLGITLSRTLPNTSVLARRYVAGVPGP